MNAPYGKLILNGNAYALQEGKNIIGRDTPSTPSDVNIRLKTADNSISRRHFQIDVKKGIAGTEHHITHLKEENQTFLISPAHQQLEVFVGDDIFLRNKHKIRIGDSELKFRLAQVATPTTQHKR